MTPSLPSISDPIPTSEPGARARVLVVDDSRVIRQALKKILDGDFDVVLAESGDVAWSFLAREKNFQMLVTDIEMPGIDGYELICRVRGSEEVPFKDLPILAITGADDAQTRERAFACGATDFVTKPVDPTQLKARVHSYIRLDQSARDLTVKATQLEEQAIADPLTGLRSRRYFVQRGEQDLAFCVRNKKDLTIIRFDIDRYKDIYRQYGEDVGDRILSWIAGIVSASARVEDTVARVGGAKFAVLATATALEEARRLCQRIQDAIRVKPFLHDGKSIDISLSFGLASLVQDRMQETEGLLGAADKRAVRAGFDGGNRICVSVLGETAPVIEEVVLDIPALAPEPELTPGINPALDHLEIPDATEARPAIAQSTAPTPAPVVDVAGQLVSVDKALQLIAAGQGRLIEPYLKALVDQLKPLLDLIRSRRQNKSS